jgi:hypothetical protein
VRFSANPDHWTTDWNGILCVFAAGCLGIAVGVVSAKIAVDTIGRMVRVDELPQMLTTHRQDASPQGASPQGTSPKGATPLALAHRKSFETLQPHSAGWPSWAAAWGDD